MVCVKRLRIVLMWMMEKKRLQEKKQRYESLPLQPFPLEEPVVVHAVEVVCEGRYTQVVVDQSGNKTVKRNCRSDTQSRNTAANSNLKQDSV